MGSNSPLALNCTSTGSPAMTVVWRKDGASLPSDLVYTTAQVLRDGTSAAYDNLLEISGSYSDIVGIYNCIIHDSLGRNSEPASLQVNGKLYIVCEDNMNFALDFFLQVWKYLVMMVCLMLVNMLLSFAHLIWSSHQLNGFTIMKLLSALPLHR